MTFKVNSLTNPKNLIFLINLPAGHYSDNDPPTPHPSNGCTKYLSKWIN